MSITQLVTSGPLILALPVAAAAGAVTFLSPCCLPLVPGYLSFIPGMAGADANQASPAQAAPDVLADAPVNVTDPGVREAQRAAASAASSGTASQVLSTA